MPPPFRSLGSAGFADLLGRFVFSRRIDVVHLHHTWRPNHADYRGHETIVGMWRYHTRENGWSDIAQHLSIAPDGTLWLGRDWNAAPASATGHNGDSRAGPFMIEMIGDFDVGRDRLQGAQRAAAIEVIARAQRRFGLPAEALRFHNQMSGKTCPGSSLSRAQVVAEVAARHLALGPAAPRDAAEEPAEESMRDIDVLTYVEGAGTDEARDEAPPAAIERGTRRALCVGIDAYSRNPLAGCVSDARLWADTLTGLGFDPPTLLLDAAATRATILQALESLVGTSRAGDVLVFQFAGHGTQLPDVDADEDDPGGVDQDEALCPFDHVHGEYIVDDDLAALFTALPEGVNLTCFIDCCHSGTICRIAAPPGPAPADEGEAADRRPRYLPASEEMVQAHKEVRGAEEPASRPRRAGVPEVVTFTACQPTELAWEKDGRGEFTLRATRLLAAGTAGWSNAEFQRQLTAAFGAERRQTPTLDCSPAAQGYALLQPVPARGATVPIDARTAAGLLRTLAAALEGGTG
jgi:hypothetical protein